MFNNDLPTLTLRTISLSFIRFTSITSSIHFSATKIPTPEIPSSQPIQKNLQLPIVLAFPPFHTSSPTSSKNPNVSFPSSPLSHHSFLVSFQHLHSLPSISHCYP